MKGLLERIKKIFGKIMGNIEHSDEVVNSNEPSKLLSKEIFDNIELDEKWFEPLNEVFQKFDISTPTRQAAFIGQCQHESGNFKRLEENLNYSKEALCRVWPKRFLSLEDAALYERNPEKIANKVYSNRMGNGPEESGEGYKYRGRGIIQLTGKNNYTNCGKDIEVDLVNEPELLLQPRYAALSAGWYWNAKELNKYADIKDWKSLTRAINGGYHGLANRIQKIENLLSILES